ncbi:type VII secretion protein EccE [Actinomadura sp. DC4]|uniref:type VII secretion protein EccE n=1 Tax=Actinomadura sp. DC4 TaxID=3055069 RepID=UPI0025AED32C|nr:type VII secretion protein EccE [Actinomadura sp. DC4]MDN3354761.1 type VII secretion protein EccE [Actinomadura sp. DC4]
MTADRAKPPLAGLRAAQVGVWAPAATGLAYGLTHQGPAGSALAAGAGVVFLSTLARRHHRWGYQWLGTALVRRRRPVPRELVLPGAPDEGVAALRQDLLPELRIRGAGPANARIGVIEDGSCWTAVVAVDAAGPGAELRPEILAPALRGDNVTLAAIQVLVHAVPNPGGGPRRTELTRIALRLDPRTAGPGSETMGAPSFQRALRLRARRVVELLTAHGRRAHTMDAAEVRAALLDDAALTPGAPSRQHWRAWASGDLRHTVFWLRRWPAAGLAEFGEAGVLSVTLTPARGDAFRATTLVRLVAPRTAARDARRAARRQGAQLVPLHGEHHQGVLATLPLGREVETPVSWRPRHTAAPLLREGGQGLLLGTGAHGQELLPVFQPGPVRIALLAGPAVAALLARRAADAGALVRAVTARPGLWPTSIERVPPGAGPVEGTSLRPWVTLDDGTGSPPAPAPWCASLDLLPEPATVATYDTALVHRPAAAVVDAVTRAYELPGAATNALRLMPRHAVALVRKGSVRLVDLTPSPEETALLGEA